LYQKQKGAVINCTFGCFDINQHYIKATDWRKHGGMQTTQHKFLH
jgi:hypothetical protein